MFPPCHHQILRKISKSDEKLGLLFRGGSEGPVAQAWGPGAGAEAGKAPVGRLSDRRTNGAGRTRDPGKATARTRSPRASGGRRRHSEASSPPGAASWALPPGPGADRAASGLRLPPPASRGARARWPAQRRKRKGTVISTPRLLSSLGEGRRIPALNQRSDRGKIVELLICKNRLIMLYVFAYPA